MGSVGRMSSHDAPPWIGAPATRALERVGVTSLRQLAGYPRTELAALHGLGPKALHVLEEHLAEHGLSLAD